MGSLNSINTNIAAFSAQRNIGIASSNVQLSVARLSSGSRIVNAADDVAALSAGTSLQTNVTTLRTALVNASQASSLLQVADGALSQVTEILQRQKAIAVQAGAGTLTNTERSFLNQEFQNLTQEIDRLVDNTNFNGVKLLDGSLFDVTNVGSKETAAEASVGSINFTENFANVSSAALQINGVSVTIGTGATNVARGNNLTESLDNLVNFLNSSTNTSLSVATYSRQGNALIIDQRAAGELGKDFSIDNDLHISTALSDNGLATGNRIGTVNGVASGYAYQQIWGFTSADVNSTSVVTTAGGSGIIQAGNISVNNDAAVAVNIALTDGDTLEGVVDKINLASGGTGVTARIVGGSGYYGIQLETSSQRDIGFSNSEASANDLTETGTSGSIQLRSNSVEIANLRTTNLDNAGSNFFQNDGVIEINGIDTSGFTTDVDTFNDLSGGAEDNQVSAFEVLHHINTEYASFGISATIEWDADDSSGSQNYRFVISTNNPTVNGVSGLTISDSSGGSTAFTGANDQFSASDSTQLIDLQGGDDDGLSQASVRASGTIGDSILNTLENTSAAVTLSFTNLTDAQQLANLNRKQIRFDTGDGFAGQQLTFTLLDTSSATQTSFDDNIVEIGTTLEDTLDNIVAAINNYANAGEVDARTTEQITARREGRNVILEYNGIGDFGIRNGADGAASTVRIYSDISQTDANLSSSATVTATGLDGGNTNQVTNFDSGNATGVDATGVINKDFVGTIDGFAATYGGTSNRVTVSITVGDDTYTATDVDTNVTTNSTVRLFSENGGYFDIQFAANQGSNVNTQEDADKIAARLDQAFSTLQFSQNRNISSYNAAGDIITNSSVTGTLTGTAFELKLTDFSEVVVDDISITAPPEGSTNGILEFTINDEVYRSRDDIGSTLAARGVYQFKSLTNPNNVLSFTAGATAIQFDSAERAASFETALKNAFGFGAGGQTLNFQVGVSTQDTLEVSIGTASTDVLYNGATLDVLTQDNAAIAADTIDVAIRNITSIRAEVGALQSRFNFAAANIESSIQNQDAARGTLLDTDVATESTENATNQVKLQAGVAVLAQANQQLQVLLKLI